MLPILLPATSTACARVRTHMSGQSAKVVVLQCLRFVVFNVLAEHFAKFVQRYS